MMQPWQSMLKLQGLLKIYKSLWTRIDSRSNIASACGRGCGSLVEIHGLMQTQHLSIRTCLVSTSTAKRCTRCGFQNFSPASHKAYCVRDHVPVTKNFKLHLPVKLSDVCSILARVRVSASLWWLRHNPLNKPLWSDYDSDKLCTV